MSDNPQNRVHLGMPPYPALDHPILDMIVNHALAAHRKGASVREAVLYAAVNAWSEGHIEGEDRCQGCSYRGPDYQAAQDMRAVAHEQVQETARRRAQLDGS